MLPMFPLIARCVDRLLTSRSYKVKSKYWCEQLDSLLALTVLHKRLISSFQLFQMIQSYHNKTTSVQFTSAAAEPHSKPQREISVGPCPEGSCPHFCWVTTKTFQSIPKHRTCLNVAQYLQIPHMTQRIKTWGGNMYRRYKKPGASHWHCSAL